MTNPPVPNQPVPNMPVSNRNVPEIPVRVTTVAEPTPNYPPGPAFDPRRVRTTAIGPARLLRGLGDAPGLEWVAHRRIHGDCPHLDRAELLARLLDSGLSGRGGAGFPLADKVMALRPGRAVVVVNGAEGEPGSAKDAVLLGRVPHLVLDGAAVLAQAIGAARAIVAVTDPAVEQLVRQAVGQRPDAARFEVHQLPARFVAGEARTVIRALNGGPQLPPGRRVHATERGIGGGPTLLANAETFAHVALLARTGPPGTASGSIPPGSTAPGSTAPGSITPASTLSRSTTSRSITPGSTTSASATPTATTPTATVLRTTVPTATGPTATGPLSVAAQRAGSHARAETGTTLLSVTGAVARPGVVEVPIGLRLGELAAHVGAGPSPWVVIGGYHGAWLAADPGLVLSRPALRAAGGTLGAGTVMFVGADTCPSAELGRVADWLADASARQCGPCAFGLPALAAQLRAPALDDRSVATMRRRLGELPGRGACAHPDGSARLLSSGLARIDADLRIHRARGRCDHADRGDLATDRVAAFTPRARS